MPGRRRSVFFPCLFRARRDDNGVRYVSSFGVTLLSRNIWPVGWNSPKHCARGGDFKSVRPGHLAACHSSRPSRCWQTCPTGSGADIGAQIIEASVHKTGKKTSTNQKSTTTTTMTTSTAKTKLLEQMNNIFFNVVKYNTEWSWDSTAMTHSVILSVRFLLLLYNSEWWQSPLTFTAAISLLLPISLLYSCLELNFFFNHNLNSFELLFAALDCVRRAQQVFACTCFVTQIVKVIRKKHKQLISHLS